MDKRAFLRTEHLAAAVAIYVAGFVVIFLILEAQAMIGETPTDVSPLAQAALWPVNLLQFVM